ncbi:MAG: CidA/LrgA family protein [Pseudorhodoplanes sp.]|nr:Holin-like protein CidA [Pseudorhodoplanes sp.]MCL4711385.1 CidA/LrgA family protein [Pseudorhodoplanes sp.]MCQ3942878.1 CidA/LrgA family protein [Alphaproteobacteria bacterium]GIK79211.1 MAG: CidA/LrgA family protein [Alphaproteobacteria bacterium]
MLPAFATLLLCQLAGEAIVRAAILPVPGPVVGMMILCALMVARAPLPGELGDTADGILKHLSLLFVPAGVGVVQQLDRLGQDGIRLVAVVIVSTVIALAVTALVFAALAKALGTDDLSGGQDDGA